jgi:hypothetical protein
MDVAADMYSESRNCHQCNQRYFAAALSDFATAFDWSTEGPLAGLGGEGGVKAAVALLRSARRKTKLKVIANG